MVASSATVSGNQKSVTFSGWSAGQLSAFDTKTQGYITAKYGASAQVQVGSVTIPQGSDIIYDPSMGSGAPPKTQPTLSAGAIAGIVIAVLFCVALIIVGIVLAVKYRHKFRR